MSCNEIDFIIEISKKENGFLGGRIMGGGFGGCTINLIDKKNKKKFISNIKKSFYKKYRYNVVVEEFLFSSGLNVVKVWLYNPQMHFYLILIKITNVM